MLIQFHLLRRVGHELVDGTHFFQHGGPHLGDGLGGEDGFAGRGDDPGAVLDLVFDLTFGPAGVADEPAHVVAHAELVEGIVYREMGLAAEGAFLAVPVQGGEGEFIGRDGAADVDAHLTEGAEALIWQEVGDALIQGAVQDVAEGALLGGVGGHEDHGARKIRITHGWNGEEQIASQRFGVSGFRHDGRLQYSIRHTTRGFCLHGFLEMAFDVVFVMEVASIGRSNLSHARRIHLPA